MLQTFLSFRRASPQAGGFRFPPRRCRHRRGEASRSGRSPGWP